MEEFVPIACLVVAGVVAGYINSMAGSGSLLTLPALIFTGLDGPAANATNRVAVLLQCGVAAYAYRRRGLSILDGFSRRANGSPVYGQALRLFIIALIAAGVGAWVSSEVSDRTLRVSLAVVMLGFLTYSVLPKRFRSPPAPAVHQDAEAGTAHGKERMHGIAAVLCAVAIGAYAGFLQAGVGVAILIFLGAWRNIPLLTANPLKVFLVLIMAAASVSVFIAQGEEIALFRGFVLTVACSVGAWLGVRAAVAGGERYVRAVLLVAVGASSAKLLFDLIRAA